jgi:hypothetical protein
MEKDRTEEEETTEYKKKEEQEKQEEGSIEERCLWKIRRQRMRIMRRKLTGDGRRRR